MGLLQQIQTGGANAAADHGLRHRRHRQEHTSPPEAPKPIFIQTEDGLGEIDCHKFPLARSLGDVDSALSELLVEPHDYQTVILDSLDWLERMIWDVLCQHYGVSSIEKVDGGYGKGYVPCPDPLAEDRRPTRPVPRASAT